MITMPPPEGAALDAAITPIRRAVLEQTVARFNEGARRGEDPDFGRGRSPFNRGSGDPLVGPNPSLAPIEHGPFHAVKVLPGEHYVDDADIMIVTVLGSCIAACLHDRTARVGGMNHFMLPDGGADLCGRYGAYAMELLINELLKRGAQRARLEAKVFGGGRVMQNFTAMNIGEQNAAFVERFAPHDDGRATARVVDAFFDRVG